MTKPFSERLQSIPPSGIRKFFDLVIGADDIISLGVGEPDFATPWSICENAIQSLEKGYTSYTSNQGLLECREAVATYLQNRFDVSYDPQDEILLTVGVSEAVDITLRAICNPGDEVILQQPNYVCYAPLIQLTGATVVPLDTSPDFVPTSEKVKSLITKKTKAIVLCSPSNPTGRVIPLETMKAIGALAEAHDLWVLSDEIYGELTYDQPYVSFASLPGMKSRTILFNGFSKAFAMTGWRLGYVCGPSDFLKQALKIHQYSTLCAPILAQYAAIEALKNCIPNVMDMKKSYQFRRNFFVKRLNEIGLPTVLPEGAFYCFPSIKDTGLSSEAFALQLLKEEKVAVVPGSAFGPEGEGFIRCCYATSEKQLRAALDGIERFLAKLNK